MNPLLKTAPSVMRQRVMSAGAAFSGSVAAACLWTALAGDWMGPAAAFVAAAVAAVALARGARESVDQARLRLCPRRGTVQDGDGDGETPFQPIGVTPNLICLTRAGGRPRSASIWRDSLAPDAFRRLAAYALWRRSVTHDSAQHFELIARKAVTEPPSDPRTGRPEGR